MTVVQLFLNVRSVSEIKLQIENLYDTPEPKKIFDTETLKQKDYTNTPFGHNRQILYFSLLSSFNDEIFYTEEESNSLVNMTIGDFFFPSFVTTTGRLTLNIFIV